MTEVKLFFGVMILAVLVAFICIEIENKSKTNETNLNDIITVTTVLTKDSINSTYDDTQFRYYVYLNNARFETTKDVYELIDSEVDKAAIKLDIVINSKEKTVMAIMKAKK